MLVSMGNPPCSRRTDTYPLPPVRFDGNNLSLPMGRGALLGLCFLSRRRAISVATVGTALSFPFEPGASAVGPDRIFLIYIPFYLFFVRDALRIAADMRVHAKQFLHLWVEWLVDW